MTTTWRSSMEKTFDKLQDVPSCTDGNARPPNRTTDVLKVCAFRTKSSSKPLCCAVHCGNLVLESVIDCSCRCDIDRLGMSLLSWYCCAAYAPELYLLVSRSPEVDHWSYHVSWWRIRSQIVVLHMWWLAYHNFSSPKLVAVVTCSIGNKQSAHNRPPHPQ